MTDSILRMTEPGAPPTAKQLESWLGEKAHAFWRQTEKTIADRYPGGRVLVVTHGGSIRRVQAAVMGMASPVVENCGRWAVAHEDGSFRPLD